jgi:hypothetical protein
MVAGAQSKSKLTPQPALPRSRARFPSSPPSISSPILSATLQKTIHALDLDITSPSHPLIHLVSVLPAPHPSTLNLTYYPSIWYKKALCMDSSYPRGTNVLHIMSNQIKSSYHKTRPACLLSYPRLSLITSRRKEIEQKTSGSTEVFCFPIFCLFLVFSLVCVCIRTLCKSSASQSYI